MEHAKLAIELLDLARKSYLENQNIFSPLSRSFDSSSISPTNKQATKSEKFRGIITTLIISYYNLGTEQEFLKQYHESTEA